MQALPAFSTCDLCDAHEGDSSGAFRVLPPVFHAYGASRSFCGPVATVACPEDISKIREAVHTPGAIELPGGGHVARVLVVAAGGSVRRAVVGGLLASAAAKNGWAGIVVDGAVRDLAEMAAAGLPVRALALTPMRGSRADAGARDVPVQVQGVWVRPGEWLYADEDGIVVSATRLA